MPGNSIHCIRQPETSQPRTFVRTAVILQRLTSRRTSRSSWNVHLAMDWNGEVMVVLGHDRVPNLVARSHIKYGTEA